MQTHEEYLDITIQPVKGTEKYPELVRIWRSSVDATHDFLADEYRDEIQEKLITSYFPHVVLVVAELRGNPVGFAGVAGQNLEMLFVDACYRGQKIGTALLDYVMTKNGVTTVDVNEQNTQTVEFYRRRGFIIVGRDALDDQGRPYPTLHLAAK